MTREEMIATLSLHGWVAYCFESFGRPRHYCLPVESYNKIPSSLVRRGSWEHVNGNRLIEAIREI